MRAPLRLARHNRPSNIGRGSALALGLATVLAASAVTPVSAAPVAELSHVKAGLSVPFASSATGYQEGDSQLVGADEYTTTYANEDGSNTTFVSLLPTNVEIDGEWQPASDVLEVDGESITAPEHPLDPTFGAEADDGVSANWQGSQVDFHLRGAEASDADASNGGDTVTYSDAVGDADLEYQLQPASVKETVRLDALPAAGVHSWSWDIHAPGLTLSKNEWQDLVFTDSTGATKFHIPAPIAWDSSGQSEVREPAMANLTSTITPLGNDTFRLSLSVRRAWLEDSSRVYPVSVDPTLTAGDTYIHAWKSDGATRTDYIHVGNTRENNTNKFWRSQAKYVYTSLAGKQVIGASFVASRLAGTATSYTGSVNTASCYGYTCVGTYLGDLTVGSASGTDNSSRLAQQYATWVNTGALNGSLMSRGYESGSYTYKELNTTLKLTWKDFPSVTGIAADGTANGAHTTVQPGFNVTAADPYGQGLEYQYTFATSSSFGSSTIYTSAWATDSAFVVPAGVLSRNATYYWRASVKDTKNGYLGVSTIRNSATWNFSTDYVGPAAPLGVSASPWANDDQTGFGTGLDPTLSAIGTHSDGLPVSTSFEVYTAPSGGTQVATCTTSVTPSGVPATCSVTLPNVAAYFVRARSTSASTTGPWSAWTSASVSSLTAAEQIFEAVLASSDPDAALAALPSARYNLLTDNGLVALPDVPLTSAQETADQSARSQWLTADSADLPDFDGAEYIEPTTDTGTPTDIDSARSAAISLLEADTSVGQMTAADLADPTDLLSQSSQDDRLATLEATWSPDVVAARAADWEDGLEYVVEDSTYVPYVENDFSITSWDGVQIDGDVATVLVKGAEEFTLEDGSTQSDDVQQKQFTLVRSASAPTGWLIKKVDTVPVAVSADSHMSDSTAAAINGTGAFNRLRAYAYATRFACNSVMPGKCYNKAYSNFIARGGDCTNFASQVLQNAGLRPLDIGYVPESWYPASPTSSLNGQTKSWYNVSYFLQAMELNEWATLKRVPASKMSQAVSGAKIGDIYLWDFGDGGSWKDHLTVSTGQGAVAKYYDKDNGLAYNKAWTNGSRISQHTTDRMNAPWNWAWQIAKKPVDKAKLRVWIIHFTFDD